MRPRIIVGAQAPPASPIQCLLPFEALAGLPRVTRASEEQCVTPSAVSQRVHRLEEIIGTKRFGRADFSLTTEGSEYFGTLVRLGTSDVFSQGVSSPHAHYLCWRTSMMDRWECAAFGDWLKKTVA